MDGRHEARVGRECMLICLENGQKWTFNNMHAADSFLGYMHGYIYQRRRKGVNILESRIDKNHYEVTVGEVKRLYPVTKGKSKEKMLSEDKFHYTSQPCWSCKKACGGCRWSRVGRPIKGWIATPTIIKNSLGDGKGDLHSYSIEWCPEFEEG